MNIKTLNEVFLAVVERNSDRVMQTRESGAWTPISSAQLQAQVFATARQLQAWGIGKGDRVAILSENRPEWAIADFATLLLGAIDVPIYATQIAEQCVYLLQHSEATIAFVSTRKQYEKIASIQHQTKVARIVIMDDAPDLTDAVPMQSFLRNAVPGPDAELEDLGERLNPTTWRRSFTRRGPPARPKA